MDEEAASVPHAPLPQSDPQFPSEFQVPLMPQPRFFPPITIEAFQAYTKIWYAQAQTQAYVGQAQYPVPPTTTFAQESKTVGMRDFFGYCRYRGSEELVKESLKQIDRYGA